MNHAKALDKAKADLARKIETNEIEGGAADAAKARIASLEERALRLRTGFERHAAAARYVNATMAAVRKARDEGRIVAIDAGWRAEEILEEVGITTREGAKSKTQTFRSKTWTKKTIAIYGKVSIVDHRELPNVVKTAYAEADLCVFHDASNDLRKTGVDITTCPYADTALLASMIENRPHSTLKNLYKRYVGGRCGHSHESGNDAARTMAVLLALAELPPMKSIGYAAPNSPRSVMFKPERGKARKVWDKIEAEETAAATALREIPFMRQDWRFGGVASQARIG